VTGGRGTQVSLIDAIKYGRFPTRAAGLSAPARGKHFDSAIIEA
jgi:hypothetical protein